MARASTPAAPAGRPRLLNENFSRTYAELWNEEGIMQNCQLKVRLHIITQPHQSRDNSNITISQSNVSSVFCIFLPSDPYTSQSNLGYLAGRLGCFATDHFFSLTKLSAEPIQGLGWDRQGLCPLEKLKVWVRVKGVRLVLLSLIHI